MKTKPAIHKMKRVNFLRRFRALCILQFHIQRRKYLQNACLCLFPVFILLFPVIVSLIAFAQGFVPVPGPSGRRISNSDFFKESVMTQDCCDPSIYVPGGMICKSHEMPDRTKNQFFGSSNDYILEDLTPKGDDILGEASFSMQNATHFLANVPRFEEERTYSIKHFNYIDLCGYSPAFVPFDSDSTPLAEVMYKASANYLECDPTARYYIFRYDINCTSKYFAGHGISMHRLKAQNMHMESTITSDLPHMAMRTLASGFIRKLGSISGTTDFSPRYGIHTTVSDPQPRFSLTGLADASLLFLYPIVACFLFPIFMSSYIEDRNLGVLKFMQLYGVTFLDEAIVRTLSDMTLFIIYMCINHLFAVLCQIIMFQKSWWYFILANPLFGYIQVMASYTFAPLFKQAGQANVAGYLLILLSCSVGSLFNLLLFDSASLPPWWYMLFPQFVYIRIIALAVTNYNTFGYLNPHWTQLFFCFLIMIGHAIFFTFTASGLITVLPKKLYVKLIRFYHSISKNEEEKAPLLKDNEDEAFFEDEEVQREKERVQNGDFSEETEVVIDGLTKIFGSGKRKKTAVDNIHLTMRKGETFGLIGSNGAGKTTLVGMLTGEHHSSRGDAYVCGYNINNQMSHIKNCVGVLPQFEVLFPTITVEEHLLFYARLRGVPISEEKSHTKGLLKDIGLEEARRRGAKKLSGGMRRRLGLAIALTGDPAVLILDEASSGLDPASTRGIWDLIIKVKESRCVLLTSHSMKEVETLSDRIGMMANGNMVCLGDLLDLKKRYSEGYKLMINCDVQNEERAKSYIQQSIPFADFAQKLGGGALLYRIKSSAMQLSDVFSNMQKGKLAQHGIKDWSLDQASLEEVFLRFAVGHDDEN